MRNTEKNPYNSRKAAGFERVARSSLRQAYVFGAITVGLIAAAHETKGPRWQEEAYSGAALLGSLITGMCTLSSAGQALRHRSFARKQEEDYAANEINEQLYTTSDEFPKCLIGSLSARKNVVVDIRGECSEYQCGVKAKLGTDGIIEIDGDVKCVIPLDSSATMSPLFDPEV